MRIFENFEHRNEKLIPRRKFYLRVFKFAMISLLILLVSLGIGVVGYMEFEKMSWVDAFLNSAMLMGGMGPVGTLQTNAGKVFAGVYALYCGFILLVSVGVFIAPIFHRFLHYFHIEEEEQGQTEKS